MWYVGVTVRSRFARITRSNQRGKENGMPSPASGNAESDTHRTTALIVEGGAMRGTCQQKRRKTDFRNY